MSKENEAINEYILQQQTRINELMQMIVMLETKNKLLEKENKYLSDTKDINSEKSVKPIPRKGLKEQITDNSQSTNSERKSFEPISNKQKLNGLRIKKTQQKSFEELPKKQTLNGLNIKKTRIESDQKR